MPDDRDHRCLPRAVAGSPGGPRRLVRRSAGTARGLLAMSSALLEGSCRHTWTDISLSDIRV